MKRVLLIFSVLYK